ncbi:MAG: PDZ domain-containing protein [Hyphomicrobiaceae bacterium]
MTKDVADGLGLKEAKGALVATAQPGTPADKAGIKSGDLIVKVDSKDIGDAKDLARAIGATPPGSTVKVAVIRDGKPLDISVKLTRLAEKSVHHAAAQTDADHAVPNLGLTVAPANEVEGAGSTGLAVLAVDPDGTAAESGLQSGDVILKAGKTKITSSKDLVGALADAKAHGRKHALVLMRRDNAEHYIAVPIAAS